MLTPRSRRGLARAAAGLVSIALLATATPRAADPVAADRGPANRVAAPISQNGKQALLAGEWRPADVSEALRVRATRGRPTPDTPLSPYVAGHIVVKFADDVTESAMGALAHEAGGTRVLRPHHADFVYVEIPKDADPVVAAGRLAGQPGVVYAEPDGRVFPLYVPNDPLYKYQWNLQKLEMPRTWDINQGGKSSIVVAVIDTGVAYLDEGVVAKAPDLAGTAFKPGYDFVWDDDKPVDLDGHGTHVTGTIAQTTNNNVGVAGMAFNVSVMPLKALFTDWDEVLGAPYPYGSSTVARAIRFAADNGANVINMSLGALVPNTATRDALTYAVGKGVFVAVAAGNSGETDNAPLYPAVYAKEIDGMVAVGAVDANLARATYSNISDYVEIVAPGGDVLADLNNDGYWDGVLQQTMDPDAVQSGVFTEFAYLFVDGTSMSSAHVAGFAALLIDQGITKPAAVEAALKKFATDIGVEGRDDETGYGVINPRATIRGLGLRK